MGFMEAGNKRLTGDSQREARSDNGSVRRVRDRTQSSLKEAHLTIDLLAKKPPRIGSGNSLDRRIFDGSNPANFFFQSK
jgi:hypothetical protein